MKWEAVVALKKKERVVGIRHIFLWMYGGKRTLRPKFSPALSNEPMPELATRAPVSTTFL